MGYLILNLGSKKPKTGEAVFLPDVVTYSEEHPGDIYGNALLIEVEYMDDDQVEK